jgi:hypothetical protein
MLLRCMRLFCLASGEADAQRNALCPDSARALAGCGDNNTASNASPPGEQTLLETQVLEAGAQVLQGVPPIDAINAYLDGFHFNNGRMEGQMEAHQYCSILNEDMTQCVIYDGNVDDAKLMGVEYIVSENLFNGFPEAEKPMWHSHVHEVTSGQLVAPGIPLIAEHELMEKWIGTYGKTRHTWHTDLHKDPPIGIPQLMMGFTADGQADPTMTSARDRRLASTAQRGSSPTGQETHDSRGAQNAPGVSVSRPPE